MKTAKAQDVDLDHNQNFEKFDATITHRENPPGYDPADFSRYLQTTDLDQSENCYGDAPLKEIRQLMATNRNIDLVTRHLTKLAKNPLKNSGSELTSEGRVTTISKKEALELLEVLKEKDALATAHMTEEELMQRGFCFGRAAIAHCEAVRRGVDPESIKKIWVVGDMGHWGHHVATAVKGDHGDWYIIDNFTESTTGKLTMSVEEWIKIMETEAKNQGTSLKNMYFLTSASRFSDAQNTPYNKLDLFNNDQDNDWYLGYFKNYFSQLDNEKAPQHFHREKKPELEFKDVMELPLSWIRGRLPGMAQ